MQHALKLHVLILFSTRNLATSLVNQALRDLHKGKNEMLLCQPDVDGFHSDNILRTVSIVIEKSEQNIPWHLSNKSTQKSRVPRSCFVFTKIFDL